VDSTLDRKPSSLIPFIIAIHTNKVLNEKGKEVCAVGRNGKHKAEPWSLTG
jgi:hypothetical protein